MKKLIEFVWDPDVVFSWGNKKGSRN